MEEDNEETQSPQAQEPRPKAGSLVVHTPRIGGGRDDCWSEEATKVLIEAWGDRFSEPGKGTLKQQQWKQVAEIVNKSGECKYPKTDIQCKNRIDTVKKKYKQEKTKLAASGFGNDNGVSSKWVFFEKLESLIGGGSGNVGGVTTRRRGGVGSSSRFKRQGAQAPPSSESMRWHFRKRSASETESESEDEPEESAESLPPVQQTVSFQFPKRVKSGGGGGVGEVAKAILGFTEAYEKAESAKLSLMMELEKERIKFAKEMELQRMQFLKTQMEISSSSQGNDQEEVEWENSRRRNVDHDDDDDDGGRRDVKNNGDVSS